MDPTDLDALLIGALYGELTPAEEARLTAHLESHPADRTALAELTQTRTQLRDSRLLAIQLDPPQSVSALLLQEAARRAPGRETESWFQRFVRSLTAHPAMAAAMMLVLVVGVAGTLYMRHEDGFGAPAPDMMRVTPIDTASTFDTTSTVAAGSAAAPEGNAAPADPQLADKVEAQGQAKDRAKGAAVVASATADEKTVTRDRVIASGAIAPGGPANGAAAQDRGGFAMAPPPPPAAAAAPAPVQRLAQGIEVRGGDELAPKDLVESPRKQAESDGWVAHKEAAKPAAGMAAPKAGRTGGAAAADDDTAALGKFRAADQAPAAQPPAPAPTESGDSWAQKQHEQVIAYVRANNCRAAASAASEIYNRAPDYYAANVEVDRAIKPCLPYLNTERERTERAKAAKRTESSPAAPAVRK